MSSANRAHLAENLLMADVREAAVGQALTVDVRIREENTSMLRFDTALGTCGLRWSRAGITQVLLPGSRALENEAPDHSTEASQEIHEAIDGLIALLGGEPVDLSWVPLDESGIDEFRRRVHAATRQIPAGASTTYGELARAIGEPGGARAVGGALGENPFPIIVPCHRVLAASGALHGFSAPGGIATQRKMLEIECTPGFMQQPLFA
jgi:methylated-DNA-[protein]-cysteine S-methyltransferase